MKITTRNIGNKEMIEIEYSLEGTIMKETLYSAKDILELIELNFVELDSPREYNFRTDYIVIELSLYRAEKLSKQYEEQALLQLNQNPNVVAQ